MKIEKDRVVRFHYTVSEVGGEPMESSKEREPLAILAGHGNIIPVSGARWPTACSQVPAA